MSKKNELLIKLTQDIDQCDWESLEKHFERGAILVVDKKINLAEAGVALAHDNTELVKKWIAAAQIFQPSMEHKEEWEKEPRKKFAKFLILQPYVLIQIISE